MGLERLWAPWRLAYIVGAVKSSPRDACLFCRVATEGEKHDRSNLVVYRGALSFAMLNRFPYNNGHVMVAPYSHVASIEELGDEELGDMVKTLKIVVRALREAYSPDGFNIGANIGRDAGAGIEGHFHVHVVPRWRGDTNFMPIISGTKVIPELLEESFDRVRNAIESALRGERLER